MEDIFQEVKDEEVPKILEALKKNWPQHFLLHQFITTMQTYRSSNSEIEKSLYKYGNIDDGVYLVKTSVKIGEETSHSFFFYTPSSDLSELSRVLLETCIVPWSSKVHFFEMTMERFSPCIAQAAEAKGAKLLNKCSCMLIANPNTKIDLKEVPQNMYLDFLNDSHVPKIDSNWPHEFPGSESYLSQYIKNNFGLGLFTKSEGKLVCWALNMHSGGIFVLFTDPQFRGKGYAEIIVRNMVVELRKRDQIPFATVMIDNIPSRNLFQKIGFENFAQVCFIFPADGLGTTPKVVA